MKIDDLICKAKTIGDRQWVEGYFFMPHGQAYSACIMPVNNQGSGVWVDAETVCRYTGMTDYDKNLVFENDIVEITDLQYRKDIGGARYGVVRFTDGCFEVLFPDNKSAYLKTFTKNYALRVVGTYEDDKDCYLTALVKKTIMEEND